MVFVYICFNNNKLIISSCISYYGKHECGEKNAKNSSRYHMFKGIVEDNVIRFYIL